MTGVCTVGTTLDVDRRVKGCEDGEGCDWGVDGVVVVK